MWNNTDFKKILMSEYQRIRHHAEASEMWKIINNIYSQQALKKPPHNREAAF